MNLIAGIQPLPYPDARLSGRRVLVYLGALDRSRRLDVLLQVFAAVRLQAPDTALLMIGRASEPADEAWLKREAELLGVTDHVVWAGWLPMQTAWSYAKSAHIGLSPIPPGRLFDISSPTKAVEYLALGLPVVGNDIPDQAEVITRSGAGVCVPFDVDLFAQAVVDLLADPGRCLDLAARGPAYVIRHRSYEVLAALVAERYRGLVRAA
jgi:glycosyltransferase involved in cell wall biosynthesis